MGRGRAGGILAGSWTGSLRQRLPSTRQPQRGPECRGPPTAAGDVASGQERTTGARRRASRVRHGTVIASSWTRTGRPRDLDRASLARQDHSMSDGGQGPGLLASSVIHFVAEAIAIWVATLLVPGIHVY